MDGRRIRPLFLPPHPRRNQYIPVFALRRRAAAQSKDGEPGARLLSGAAEEPRSSRRPGHLYAFCGSGYSTPKVSTVTFFIRCGVRGRSL